MKTPNLSSAFYAPENPPSDASEMGRFLSGELQKIQSCLALLAAGHIDKSNAAPARPREGDIRLADGTQWNPGSGAGLYAYYGSAWVPLAANGHVVVNNNAAATYTVPANTNYVGFTGTQVATLAFTFPAASASIDGLQIRVYTQAAVGTSATWASTGATFVGAPATLAAGSVTRFIYNHGTAQWLQA